MNSTEKEVIKIIKNQYPSVSRKVSYFLFLCISVSLWLMLFFPQIVSAEDILSSLKTSSNSKEMEEISISFSEYQYQNALYLYLTGDYFSSSILSSNIINSSLSKMKDKAILLLKQSDINRLSKMREDPIFSFQSFPKEVSERVRLVDVIYEMNEYERLFLSKELDNLGTANFFEGISLLRLNRLADSKRLLLKIPKNDKLYPYAKISIAQIEIMKQNYKEGEKILRDILNHPAIEKENLSDRIHILLGQVLFEMGSYSYSLNEFLIISPKSQFYKESVVGQAWSLIKLGYFESAIPILKEIKLVSPYSQEEQEVQIVLGYCYLKTGMIKEAVEHFQSLSNVYSETERRLELIISDKTIRGKYVYNFIGNDSVSVNDKEQYYLSILRSKSDLAGIIEEYRLLNILKNSFLRKKDEIMDREIYIDNTIKWMENMQKKIEKNMKNIKNTMLALNDKENKNKKIDSLKGVEITKNQTLNDHWQKILKRQMTETEKKIVESIIYEAAESMECLNSPVTCPIFRLVGDSKMDRYNKPEDLKRIVLTVEKIGRDIDRIQKNDKIEFENTLSKIIPIFQKRIGRGEKDLEELKIIKDRLNGNIADTDKALDEIMNRLDNNVAERFKKIKYELADFKDDIITGLDTANKNMEMILKEKGKQKPTKK